MLVVRLTSDKPGRVSFTASLTRLECATTQAMGTDGLVMSGQLFDGSAMNGMKFIARLRALNEGGKITTTADALRVEGANAVTLLLTAATDYRGKPHEKISDEQLRGRQRRRRMPRCAMRTSRTTRNSSAALRLIWAARMRSIFPRMSGLRH